MTPPCRVFSSRDLEAEVQKGVNGKRRKGDAVDLSRCPQFAMTQYDCQIDRPAEPNSPVRCYEVQRWFRRYVGSCLWLAVVSCAKVTWRGPASIRTSN
jgi:hypothetical protein